jgi:hypothetical protein
MKLVRQIILSVLFLGCLGGWLYLIWLERSYGLDADNYTSIEDGLWMGGYVEAPPRGTRAVLNLCEREDSYSCEVHKWEPIKDAKAPELDWLRKQVNFVDEQRKAGRVVYVHCRNGVSRSGLVVIAYLMSKHNWTRDQATEYVCSKRDIVRPNSAFRKLLLDWEKVLKEKR